MSVLVVAPTYNEVENIGSFISKLMFLDSELHVLVIDDGSPDGTADEVRRQQQQYPGRVFLQCRPGKLGLVSAYVQGFTWAIEQGVYRTVVQMDTDGQHDIAFLPAMLAASSPNTLIIGSRYVKGGQVVGFSLSRRLLSRSANLYANVIGRSGVNDSTGAYRVWDIDLLSSIDWSSIKAVGYGGLVEILVLVRRSGGNIIEMPITFGQRVAGESKMDRRMIFEGMRAIWTTARTA